MRLKTGLILLAFLIPSARADEIIVGTPGEIMSAQIGRSVGDAANQLFQSRIVSVQRQSKIIALQNQLQTCGNCPDAPSLAKQLKEARDTEVALLEQADNMIGNPAVASVFNMINDPFDVLGQAHKERLQGEQRSLWAQNLIALYCYASTDSRSTETECARNITLQDFVESQRLAISSCGVQAPDPLCIKAKSLTAVMQATISQRCSIDVKELVRPSYEVFAMCNHPTRGKPVQDVRPVIADVNYLDGGYPDSLGLRGYVKFSYVPISYAWVNSHRYRTITCYYAYRGETTARKEVFWYVKSPAGASELLESARTSLPPSEVKLGLLTLGPSGVISCPATYEAATALKAEILKFYLPTNSGDIFPGKRIYGALTNDFAGRAQSEPGLEMALKEARRVGGPILECTYLPVELSKMAIYYYWKENVPIAWKLARDTISKAYAAHPAWPPPIRELGDIERQDCPPTLADAQRITATFGQPGPQLREFID